MTSRLCSELLCELISPARRLATRFHEITSRLPPITQANISQEYRPLAGRQRKIDLLREGRSGGGRSRGAPDRRSRVVKAPCPSPRACSPGYQRSTARSYYGFRFGCGSRRRREHINSPPASSNGPFNGPAHRAISPRLPAPRVRIRSGSLKNNKNEPPQNIEAGSFGSSATSSGGGKPAGSCWLASGSRTRPVGRIGRRRERLHARQGRIGHENPTCVLAGCVEDRLAEADRLTDRSERSGRARGRSRRARRNRDR
jgi:hypothetical protein